MFQMVALISYEWTRNVPNSFYITETRIKAHTEKVPHRIPAVTGLNHSKIQGAVHANGYHTVMMKIPPQDHKALCGVAESSSHRDSPLSRNILKSLLKTDSEFAPRTVPNVQEWTSDLRPGGSPSIH